MRKPKLKKVAPLETLRFLIFQGVGDRFCLGHLPSEESRGIALTQKNNENFFRYFFCDGTINQEEKPLVDST